MSGIFPLCHHVQISSGAPSASYPMGSRVLFPAVKWQVHEADHSPPCSTDVKIVRSNTSTLAYVFMAQYLETGTTLPYQMDLIQADIFQYISSDNFLLFNNLPKFVSVLLSEALLMSVLHQI